MPQSIGVPVKLLHEAEGHKVTVELTTGELYRGMLTDVEDNMNCQMSNVTYTARDGQVSKMLSVYLRGSQVCGRAQAGGLVRVCVLCGRAAL